MNRIEKWAIFSFHTIWEFVAGKLVDNEVVRKKKTRRSDVGVARTAVSYLGRLAAAKDFISNVVAQTDPASASKGNNSTAAGVHFAPHKTSDRKILRVLKARHDKRNAVVIRTRIRQDVRDDALVQRYEYRIAKRAFVEQLATSQTNNAAGSPNRRANQANQVDDGTNLELDDAPQQVALISAESQQADLEPLLGDNEFDTNLLELSTVQIHKTVFRHHLQHTVAGVDDSPTLDDIAEGTESPKAKVKKNSPSKPTKEKVDQHPVLAKFAKYSPFTVHKITEEQFFIPINIRAFETTRQSVAASRGLIREHSECYRPTVHNWRPRTRILQVCLVRHVICAVLQTFLVTLCLLWFDADVHQSFEVASDCRRPTAMPSKAV